MGELDPVLLCPSIVLGFSPTSNHRRSHAQDLIPTVLPAMSGDMLVPTWPHDHWLLPGHTVPSSAGQAKGLQSVQGKCLLMMSPHSHQHLWEMQSYMMMVEHKGPPARTKEIQGTDFTGTTQSQGLPQCQTGSRGIPTNVKLGVLIVRVYRKCRCG